MTRQDAAEPLQDFLRRHELPVPDHREYLEHAMNSLFTAPEDYLEGRGPVAAGPLGLEGGDSRRWTHEVRIPERVLVRTSPLQAVFAPGSLVGKNRAVEDLFKWCDAEGVDVVKYDHPENGDFDELRRTCLEYIQKQLFMVCVEDPVDEGEGTAINTHMGCATKVSAARFPVVVGNPESCDKDQQTEGVVGEAAGGVGTVGLSGSGKRGNGRPLPDDLEVDRTIVEGCGFDADREVLTVLVGAGPGGSGISDHGGRPLGRDGGEFSRVQLGDRLYELALSRQMADAGTEANLALDANPDAGCCQVPTH